MNPAKSKTGDSEHRRKRYVVVSCDEDEGQIFEDWVVAVDEDAAVAKFEALRGDYATVCAVLPLAEHIQQVETQLQELKQLHLVTDAEYEAGWLKAATAAGLVSCTACERVVPADEADERGECSACTKQREKS